MYKVNTNLILSNKTRNILKDVSEQFMNDIELDQMCMTDLWLISLVKRDYWNYFVVNTSQSKNIKNKPFKILNSNSPALIARAKYMSVR